MNKEIDAGNAPIRILSRDSKLEWIAREHLGLVRRNLPLDRRRFVDGQPNGCRQGRLPRVIHRPRGQDVSPAGRTRPGEPVWPGPDSCQLDVVRQEGDSGNAARPARSVRPQHQVSPRSKHGVRAGIGQNHSGHRPDQSTTAMLRIGLQHRPSNLRQSARGFDGAEAAGSSEINHCILRQHRRTLAGVVPSGHERPGDDAVGSNGVEPAIPRGEVDQTIGANRGCAADLALGGQRPKPNSAGQGLELLAHGHVNRPTRADRGRIVDTDPRGEFPFHRAVGVQGMDHALVVGRRQIECAIGPDRRRRQERTARRIFPEQFAAGVHRLQESHGVRHPFDRARSAEVNRTVGSQAGARNPSR